MRVGIREKQAAIGVEGGMSGADGVRQERSEIRSVQVHAQKPQVVSEAAEIHREFAPVWEPVDMMASGFPAGGGHGVLEIGAVWSECQDIKPQGLFGMPGVEKIEAVWALDRESPDGEEDAISGRAPFCVEAVDFPVCEVFLIKLRDCADGFGQGEDEAAFACLQIGDEETVVIGRADVSSDAFRWN